MRLTGRAFCEECLSFTLESLQLSLELLVKPQGQKVSAGAGGALPPQVLLHSQLLRTEEEEEGSHGQ